MPQGKAVVHVQLGIVPESQRAKHTFNSDQASSGPSVGADSSLVTFALEVRPSNVGGGELAFELDRFDGGRVRSSKRPCMDRGEETSSANRSEVDRVLDPLPTRLCAAFVSSIDRNVGLKADDGDAVAGGDAGVKRSCSALVALRMQTVLPMSVTVRETWLAAASSRLTGDMPALVAWVFTAATKLLSVASARSRRACRDSISTSARSRAGRRSKARTSSTIAVTALTTDFMGVSTLVGELDRPAVKRPSMAERNAVT